MVILAFFSDFTHPLEGVKTSDLVWSGQGTSLDGVEGLKYHYW